MRENILASGGEIHFDCRVEDLILKGTKIKGVIDQNGNKIFRALRNLSNRTLC